MRPCSWQGVRIVREVVDLAILAPDPAPARLTVAPIP